MGELAKISVRHPADPSVRMQINEQDFDPAKHQLWSDAPSPAPPAAPIAAKTKGKR